MRRPSFRFIVLSVLGGLLGTAVCAGPAAVLNRACADRAARYEWRTYEQRSAGFRDVILRSRMFVDRWTLTYRYANIASDSTDTLARSRDKELPPAWVIKAGRQTFMEQGSTEWIAVTGSGWPFRALRYTEWSHPYIAPVGMGAATPKAPNAFGGGWWVKNIDNDGATIPLIVPYVPIWPGLIADQLVWSAAAALALYGVKRLRAAYRRRRGRCEACTYPRAGLAPSAPCPECGHACKGMASLNDASR